MRTTRLVSFAYVLVICFVSIAFEEDCMGHTPLQLASLQKDIKTVERLLQKDADIDIKTERGETLLHLAVTINGCNDNIQTRSALVDLLIKNGCDVTALNEEGKTFLYDAARYGTVEEWEIILKNYRIKDILNLPMTSRKLTPLHMVAMYSFGRSAIVKMLIDAGADCYSHDGNNRTPGDVAKIFGDTETQKIFMEAMGR